MSLPFKNDTFYTALASLIVHHWPDKTRRLAGV